MLEYPGEKWRFLKIFLDKEEGFIVKYIGKTIFYTNLCYGIDPSSYRVYRRYTVRVKVTLACQECKQRNYNTMKNKKNNPDRIEMEKYCKFCKKHTTHKETK